MSQGRSRPLLVLGDGRPPTFNDGNPYNGYINPYGFGLMTIPYYMEIIGSWSTRSHIYRKKCLHFESWEPASAHPFPVDSIIWSSLPPLFVSERGCRRKAARGRSRAGTGIHLCGDTIVGTEDGFLRNKKNGHSWHPKKIQVVVGGRYKNIIV